MVLRPDGLRAVNLLSTEEVDSGDSRPTIVALPGSRQKRKAWGFSAVINGRQVRVYRAGWAREDAEKALAAALLKIEQPKPATSGITLSEAIEGYSAAKSRKKTLVDDKSNLKMLAYFGPGTPLPDITASRISAWKSGRLSAVCPTTGQAYTAAPINRPLAALRHLLRLARDEWEALPTVPRIRFEKEPQGPIRWLEADQECRLLAACRRSRSPELAAIVTLVLESGMRRGEVLGLTWDRVDLSRGVIRLELTKGARRREVPMRQVVYDTLTALPGPREGRVFRTRSIRTAFETAVKAAKLDDFRFHDTRHHFASWFMMRGGNSQELKELLGHDDALRPPVPRPPAQRHAADREAC